MRKTIIALAVIIMLSTGCGHKTPEDKAKELIEDYIEEHYAMVWSTYEFVEMSEVQPTDTSDIGHFDELYSLKNELADIEYDLVFELTTYTPDTLKIHDLKKQKQQKLDEIKAFKEELSKTFFVDFKYSTLSLLGPYKRTERFYFDDMMTKIIMVDD